MKPIPQAELDTAIEIKERMRACETPEELNAVVDEVRPMVIDLQKTDTGRTQAIMISNLKSYLLKYRMS